MNTTFIRFSVEYDNENDVREYVGEFKNHIDAVNMTKRMVNKYDPEREVFRTIYIYEHEYEDAPENVYLVRREQIESF